MDSKLNGDEINALQSLGEGASGGELSRRAGEMPQRLFAFNLVTRQPSGAAVLTKNGQRALFRQECFSALVTIDAGASFAPASGVRNWLLSGGFIEKPGADSARPAITRRGKLWLASFNEDEVVVATEPTAADFARRRT